MVDFLEFDDEKKTVKSLNLDDFSVEDLIKYIKELESEKKRYKIYTYFSSTRKTLCYFMVNQTLSRRIEYCSNC